MIAPAAHARALLEAARQPGAMPYGLEHRRPDTTPRWPGYAVGVCGFGRCGSTMTMAMLVTGGCPPGNASRPPYEGDPAALRGRDLSGRCVKLLHGGAMAEIPDGPTPAWRFVWLDRDPVEQARSHVKFLRAAAPATGILRDTGAVARLADTYRRDRPVLLGLLRRIGPVLVFDYERVLAQPRKAAKLLRREIWPGLDVDAAAEVVHQREGACLPGLAVEGTVARGGRP